MEYQQRQERLQAEREKADRSKAISYVEENKRVFNFFCFVRFFQQVGSL